MPPCNRLLRRPLPRHRRPPGARPPPPRVRLPRCCWRPPLPPPLPSRSPSARWTAPPWCRLAWSPPSSASVARRPCARALSPRAARTGTMKRSAACREKAEGLKPWPTPSSRRGSGCRDTRARGEGLGDQPPREDRGPRRGGGGGGGGRRRGPRLRDALWPAGRDRLWPRSGATGRSAARSGSSASRTTRRTSRTARSSAARSATRSARPRPRPRPGGDQAGVLDQLGGIVDDREAVALSRDLEQARDHAVAPHDARNRSPRSCAAGCAASRTRTPVESRNATRGRSAMSMPQLFDRPAPAEPSPAPPTPCRGRPLDRDHRGVGAPGRFPRRMSFLLFSSHHTTFASPSC